MAEDSNFAVRDFRRKIAGWDRPHEIMLVKDGETLVAWLDRTASEAPEALPDIAVLDLDMPRIGGIQALSYIRQSPALMDLPVLIWTVSDSPFDISMTGGLRIEGYIRKSESGRRLRRELERVARQRLAG